MISAEGPERNYRILDLDKQPGHIKIATGPSHKSVSYALHLIEEEIPILLSWRGGAIFTAFLVMQIISYHVRCNGGTPLWYVDQVIVKQEGEGEVMAPIEIAILRMYPIDTPIFSGGEVCPEKE